MQCIVFQQNECTFCVNEKKPHVAPNNIVHEFNIPKLILVHPYKVKKKIEKLKLKNIFLFFLATKQRERQQRTTPTNIKSSTTSMI